MQPTYNPESKSVLERHQDCIKAIYACKTQEDFDAIPTWIDQYALPDKNLETMNTVIVNQARLHNVTVKPLPVEDPNVARISAEYAEVDKENFTESDLAESGITIEVSGGTTEPVQVEATTDPLDSIPAPAPVPEASEEKPKRTRKTKENDQSAVIPQTFGNSVTLKRRINLPIEGVQYSNNEF